MRVRRCAAAEKAERLLCTDGVPLAWRDEDGIAGADLARFTAELHFSRAFEDEVKLLAEPVPVPLRRATGGQSRFGKTLEMDWRICPVEDGADGGAILCRKGSLRFKVADVHGASVA